MSNDAVVEIRDPQGAVRSELQIDGAEPRIRDADQVWHFMAHARAAAPFDAVAIDTAGHHVADNQIITKFLGPRRIIQHRDAANRRAAVRVLYGGGSKTETIIRRTKAGIPSAAQQLVNG